MSLLCLKPKANGRVEGKCTAKIKLIQIDQKVKTPRDKWATSHEKRPHEGGNPSGYKRLGARFNLRPGRKANEKKPR